MPRLLGRSTLAPRFSSSLTIARWSLAAATCSRATAVARPSPFRTEPSASIAPPLRSHLPLSQQLAPLRRREDLEGQWGAGELSAGSRQRPMGRPAGARQRQAVLSPALRVWYTDYRPSVLRERDTHGTHETGEHGLGHKSQRTKVTGRKKSQASGSRHAPRKRVVHPASEQPASEQPPAEQPA